MSARQAANGGGYDPLPDPLCARLLPRLACALNRPLFVHFVQAVQAPPALGRHGKNVVSKIVQICASFCIRAALFLHLINFAERHHDRQALRRR